MGKSQGKKGAGKSGAKGVAKKAGGGKGAGVGKAKTATPVATEPVVVKQEAAPADAADAADASAAGPTRDTPELKRLYGRMATAVSKAPTHVQAAYNDAWSKGPGKNQVKREFLEAWVASVESHNEFGSAFFEQTTTSANIKQDGDKKVWVTYGRLEILLGSDASTTRDNNWHTSEMPIGTAMGEIIQSGVCVC
jgi:hypothetical protein